MNKLLIASNNTHKVNEFKEIFSNYEVISLKDININMPILMPSTPPRAKPSFSCQHIFPTH